MQRQILKKIYIFKHTKLDKSIEILVASKNNNFFFYSYLMTISTYKIIYSKTIHYKLRVNFYFLFKLLFDIFDLVSKLIDLQLSNREF